MQFPTMLLVVTLLLLSACAPIAPLPAASGETSTVEEAAHAHGDDAHGGAEYGDVNFPVTCSPEAQAAFSLGLAQLHSFEYPTAIETFNQAAEIDPSCAMAYWGVAMSLVEPLWGEPTAQMLADGSDAVEKAMAASTATPREQAYIDAIALFYTDSDTVDHLTRAVAYEQAMAQLVEEYPDDAEARIFYALALLATAQPTDKTYANQQQAVALLEKIFAEQPNHPGVAHYLIHSNDYPALAMHGLDAALLFADIAPAAPMRCTCRRISLHGWATGKSPLRQIWLPRRQPMPTYRKMLWEPRRQAPRLHAQDYMMYAYLQLAQDEAAAALMDEINALESADSGAAYALAAMPARYVLERGQWAEAADLTLHPESFAWDSNPDAEAIVVFARGLGAARVGDVDSARQRARTVASPA